MMPGVDTGGGGFQGSSAASSSATGGDISIGSFTFAPGGQTANFSVMAMAAVVGLGLLAFVFGRKRK